jgi:hypothetical protein
VDSIQRVWRASARGVCAASLLQEFTPGIRSVAEEVASRVAGMGWSAVLSDTSPLLWFRNATKDWRLCLADSAALKTSDATRKTVSFSEGCELGYAEVLLRYGTPDDLEELLAACTGALHVLLHGILEMLAAFLCVRRDAIRDEQWLTLGWRWGLQAQFVSSPAAMQKISRALDNSEAEYSSKNGCDGWFRGIDHASRYRLWQTCFQQQSGASMCI